MERGVRTGVGTYPGDLGRDVVGTDWSKAEHGSRNGPGGWDWLALVGVTDVHCFCGETEAHFQLQTRQWD